MASLDPLEPGGRMGRCWAPVPPGKGCVPLVGSVVVPPGRAWCFSTLGQLPRLGVLAATCFSAGWQACIFTRDPGKPGWLSLPDWSLRHDKDMRVVPLSPFGRVALGHQDICTGGGGVPASGTLLASSCWSLGFSHWQLPALSKPNLQPWSLSRADG